MDIKKNIAFLLCLFITNILLCASTLGKPVAILGDYTDTLINKIIIANNIKYEQLKSWLPVSEYKNYSVIYFSERLRGKNYKNGIGEWDSVEAQKQVIDYLKSGGRIIITGPCFYFLANKGRNLKGIEPILGFAYYLTEKNSSGVKITSPLSPFNSLSEKEIYFWQSNISIAKLSSAQVLARYISKEQKLLAPFATVNTVGKGSVYWFGLPIMRLFQSLDKLNKHLGDADETGAYSLSKYGKDAEAYCEVISKTILEAEPAISNLKTEEWAPIPLGRKGELSYSKRISETSKTSSGKMEIKKSDFLLAENGHAKAEIILATNSSKKARGYANILKQHLDKITAADFKIKYSENNSSNSPRIILGLYSNIKSKLTKSDIVSDITQDEEIFLKTSGDTLIISASDEEGLRLALYTFLESLGCRYLWPGELGKVIPQKSTLYAPELSIREMPKLVMRNIRMSVPGRGRSASALARIGLNPKKYSDDYGRLLNLDQQDESWYAWHRLGSRKKIARGHSFNDYYKKYGKLHPEWFALQANGTRSQFLSEARPRLCHSNQYLIEEIATNVIKQFDAKPQSETASICLPDGGYTTFCLCEKCRRIDPINAPPITMQNYLKGFPEPFEYVSLTDRVISFSNRIATEVAKKYPDKKLSIYAYSLYSNPPVSVKPHPNLLIFLVGMNYENEDARQTALNDWTNWASLGNQMFFRPNCLLANRKKIMPQNFSRKIFNDFKYIYNHNLIGTDFDSCLNNWALDGLNAYILAKAHWNPDKLDYDDLLQDYCKSGFGSGWQSMYQYFLTLEELSDSAANKKLPIFDLYNNKVFEKLNLLLGKASDSTNGAGEKIAEERVQFIKTGLDFAVAQKSFYDSIETADSEEKKTEIIENYKQFLRAFSGRDKFAVNLSVAVYFNPHLR